MTSCSSDDSVSFLIWRSLVRFPWGTATLGFVSCLARTLQSDHLMSNKMIRSVGGARKIVGPAPDLSLVLSVYRPIGLLE